jgi:NAD(P)-dependent dehydrogenase (short-subunit alcohol dehydrogenase family)
VTADSFQGAPTLVTGSSSGIGEALIEHLVAQGARVVALSRSGKSPDGVVARISCDVGRADSVAEAYAEIRDLFGDDGLAHVVCSAGVVSEHPLEDLEPEEWHRVVDASLTGTYLTLHHAVPLMKARGKASVVAMSSGWARRGYPRGAHYAAAKGGIEALVRSAALELAPHNIRVNAVSPGPVKTKMLDSLPNFDEAQRAKIIPLGRVGEVEDVVAPTLFLLGDGADHITGQVLQVSGGLTLT